MGFPFWLDEGRGHPRCVWFAAAKFGVAGVQCSDDQGISRLWLSIAIVKVSLFKQRINDPRFYLASSPNT